MEKSLREVPDSKKRKYRYHTVNIPMNMAEKISETIKDEKVNHSSIPDFVKAAVRNLLDEIKLTETQGDIKLDNKDKRINLIKKSLLDGTINLEEYLELKKLIEENKIF